jgi:hypothetical protein
MNELTKVSDITASDIWDYLRPSDSMDTDTENFLKSAISVSKSFVMNYTGRTEEELDNYQDFIIVILVLCQDMYDTRTLYVDKTNLNHVVDSILQMHSVNLL